MFKRGTKLTFLRVVDSQPLTSTAILSNLEPCDRALDTYYNVILHMRVNTLKQTSGTALSGFCQIYCAVSVSQNLKFSVGRIFECPDFEFELDFDRQTPNSNSGQNLDSAVRRRLVRGYYGVGVAVVLEVAAALEVAVKSWLEYGDSRDLHSLKYT